jgi:hypothetical protein
VKVSIFYPFFSWPVFHGVSTICPAGSHPQNTVSGVSADRAGSSRLSYYPLFMSTSSNPFDFSLFVSSLFSSESVELTELASIPIGLQVVRGRYWNDGNKDGGAGNVGVVLKLKLKGYLWVQWSGGEKHLHPKAYLATAGETNREGKEGRRVNKTHSSHPFPLCIAF